MCYDLLTHHDRYLLPHQEDSLELVHLLSAHDFVGFETHLKSLVQFYNQASNNCEPALMYRALSAMEAVLITINEKRCVCVCVCVLDHELWQTYSNN